MYFVGGSEGEGAVTVLIADDEKFVRRALRSYLTEDPQIVVLDEAEDGAQAVSLTRSLTPDVVLMDLQMPGMDGIDATRRIKELDLDARVLVVTGHVGDTFLIQSLLAGASGYIVKDSEPHQLVEAVRGVHAGDRPIDPVVTHHLIDELRQQRGDEPDDVADVEVTERERDVLEALCEGESNREIASHLYISEPTVKYYLGGLMRKFGVSGRVELVVTALRNGVVR